MRRQTVFFLAGAAAQIFADSGSLPAAFTNGTLKGTAGTYMEYRDFAAPDRDFGWGTGYLYIKGESDRYYRTKAGAAFLRHTRLWHDEDNRKDNYREDIEELWGIPELYLDAGLTEGSKTSLRLGRWDNKGTHIDDAQSEGFYLYSGEWTNISFRAGGFRKFAELDYDDGEDFGRNNGSQEVGDNTVFGPDAASWVFFAEADAKCGFARLNPYLYVHDGYANVFGLDTDSSVETGEDSKAGVRADGYYVQADDAAGLNDGQAGTVAPYLTVGPVTWTVGYIRMGGSQSDVSMNRPWWFADYLEPGDQTLPYSNQASMQDLESFYTKVKYTRGAFWTHLAFFEAVYDSSRYGTANYVTEFQTGYSFICGLDLNLRLFHCEFEGPGQDAVDYNKAELLARYNF